MSLLESAKQYLQEGFSIIPVALIKLPNGKSRKPALVDWKKYQHSPPTLEAVNSWFSNPEQFEPIRNGHKLGIAIITGRVSGNLAVIDFDSKEVAGEFLGELYEASPKLYEKFINTWVVETGKGFHYYFRVKDPDPKLFHNRIGIREGIDIRAEGGFVVCPPSPHPSRKLYRFVNKPERIAELTWEEYSTLLRILERNEGLESRFERSLEQDPTPRKSKDFSTSKDGEILSESKILEIVNLIKPIYRQGYRNYIILFLSGWLRKAGVYYSSARKIVEILAEGDEEKDLRFYVLDRTYGLKGNPPTEEELKGKSGLQEIAERQLGEEKSLELIRRLEEKLGKASPFRDSIFSLIDFSRKLYYVANPRKGIIARAYEDQKNGGIVYRELIAECCPVRVVVFEDPLGGVRKFEIEFDGLLKKTIGPAELEVIVQRLKAKGIVKHKRLIEDALSSLVIAFIRNGKAEIRRELEKPGFYFIEGQIKAVKWEAEEFDKEDLRNSLNLLNELREEWYNRLAERFSTVVKWGLLAPFSYAIKQIRGSYGIHFPWLLLHGSSHTGKTTLGKIIRAIWSQSLEEKGGSHIDTVPRFGKVVSETTFPILINEVADVLAKDSLREILKSSIESPFARGRYVQGVYVEEPSLATMIFTTNKTYPSDDALLRRFIGILFTLSDRVSEKKARQFESGILPRIYGLRFLGYFVFQRIAESPELLKKDWKEVSTSLLREAYEYAGMEVPSWIDELHEGESLEEITEIINEEIRARILDDLNQRYSRHISKVEALVEGNSVYTSELKHRVKALLEGNFVPWASLKGDNVVITNSVLKILDDLAVDSLKSLAERFGWVYNNVRIRGDQGKRIIVSFDEFIRFLEGSEVQEDSEEIHGDFNEFEHYEEVLGL